jgi:hypothetical protein
MKNSTITLLCVLLAGSFSNQQVFAQTPASNFVLIPADIVCSLKQIGIALTKTNSPEHGVPNPIVDLSCSVAGAAPKAIDLVSGDELTPGGELTRGILSTKKFGDFHITGFPRGDVTDNAAPAASSNDGSLSVAIASDQLESLRAYLKQ